MFFRKKSSKIETPEYTPRARAGSSAPRLVSLNSINLGLTAVASVGPKRFRPHAQAILALIAAAQALFALLRDR